MPNGGLSATSGSGKHHRRINSAETVALSLLSFRPDAQQAEPRVSDLEWLVGDGDTPQEVRYVALVKRPVVRFILQGERPDFQSCYVHTIKSIVFTFQALPLPANFASPSQETKSISPSLVASPSKASSSKSASAMSEIEFGESTELRGSLEWAPPRAQLILKVHAKKR